MDAYTFMKMLDYNNTVFNQIFKKPVAQNDTGAPNEAHFADRATWLDAVAAWDRKMELAAGCACCAEEITPEQQRAFDVYESALAAVRKAT